MSYGEYRNLQSDMRTVEEAELGHSHIWALTVTTAPNTHSQKTSDLNVGHPARDKREETSETTEAEECGTKTGCRTWDRAGMIEI